MFSRECTVKTGVAASQLSGEILGLLGLAHVGLTQCKKGYESLFQAYFITTVVSHTELLRLSGHKQAMTSCTLAYEPWPWPEPKHTL